MENRLKLYVYAVSVLPQRRPIKLGFGRAPKARFTNLQIGNHRELELSLICLPVGHSADHLERILHNAFAANHIRGEWYDVTVADVMRVLAEHGEINFGPTEPVMSSEEMAAAMKAHPRYR